MAYYELLIPSHPPQSDALIPYLEEMGCNGYMESEDGLYAYIEEKDFDESALSHLLRTTFQIPDPAYTKTLLPDKNWNKEWEKNFQSQEIDDQVLIRAPFHDENGDFPYTITIEPAMAFGTGHHATTANMIRLQLETAMKNRRVFDYGTGTGILAILAEMQGSHPILASEIQEDALRNTQKNIELNNCRHIQLTSENIEELAPHISQPFDVILANITRNTIIASISYFNQLLQEGGTLICSGYLKEEQKLLDDKLQEQGFQPQKALSEGKWGAAKYRKLP